MLTEVGSVNWYEYLNKFGIVPQNTEKRKRKKKDVLNVFAAFDIETSTIWLDPDKSKFDVHSFLYIWQFQLEEYTVTGRTWEEYFKFLSILREAIDRIKGENNLSEPPLLIIWVHNLAYEFSFLSGLYPFTDDETFFRDVRKPIYCRMYECFEYRCSYIQSNLSLSALCKQSGVKQKLSGQKFDYDKIRFPWTSLTEFEKEYCITDVESLVKAMKVRVSRSGDTLLTVPLTSTGYVRRECLESLKDQYLFIRSLKPEEDQYRLLRKSFRGGNTHANKMYATKILKDVYSYDISSSYPTQQLTKKFPMRAFKWLNFSGMTPKQKIDRLFTFIGLGYAVVGFYQFKNIRLKNKKEPIPYISLSRAKPKIMKLDNGRILEADYMELGLTEIDLKIILEQYTFDEMAIVSAMVADKDYLPPAYRDVIQSYYNKKTKLKGDDTEEGKYLYMKSKNMLNSVYGMSATDPIHQLITYADGEYIKSSYEQMTEKEIHDCLKKASFPYQWGVYTTAYAREQLQNAIKLAGSKLVYCDTDSIKTIGPVDIEKLNAGLRQTAINRGAYADDKNGVRHYIGLFEPDGHYDRFITQGAKRYAYEIDGKLGITVAGLSTAINEETNISFAVEELGSLENFTVGRKWEKAGGTLSVFNDTDDFMYTDPVSGNSVHISKNVAIVPTTYIMKHSKDYADLLKEIKLYSEYQKERE